MTTLRPQLLYGVAIGVSFSLSTLALAMWYYNSKPFRPSSKFDSRPIQLRSDEIVNGVTGLIGNTPLLRINSLSNALGVEILGKAEFLNPGGSVKDRVALQMINDAEAEGLLKPNTNSMIFEGTVGSTGISITTVAAARGYNATIVMPDDVAEDKTKALLCLGAKVEKVRPVSIVDKKQFVNLAKQRAMDFGQTVLNDPEDDLLVSSQSRSPISINHRKGATGLDLELEYKPRGFFADQFENQSNFEAHFTGTGPEIWRQTNGTIDAFVSGAGTGGTIAGIGVYLKGVQPDLQVVLADPEGSGLYNKVKEGVMYDPRESEGRRRRHQVDTVVEGIGINRLTKNFELAVPVIDDAIRVTDIEAVSMSRWLVKHDGLFLGSSSACNLVAAVRVAKKLGRNSKKTIVTILCDSGARHYAKFWNDDYLRNNAVVIDPAIVETMLRE